jgi:hypothetical protein
LHVLIVYKLSDMHMYKVKTQNIFDNLPSLAPLRSAEVIDELTFYLTTDLVNTTDGIKWWREKEGTYPRLSRMALDYLSIPGTSYLAPTTLNSQHPSYLLFIQQLLSTLSASSVVAASSFHILGAACRLLQRVPFCVLDLGAWQVW